MAVPVPTVSDLRNAKSSARLHIADGLAETSWTSSGRNITMKLSLVSVTFAAGLVALFLDHATADDYSCSAAKPCVNGACCGASGYCGYGPTYCGTGCQSNCTATAECGQYAAVPSTKCPLNVCCSQYGFCGTTSEFCDPAQKCQSGCGQPKKPSSGGTSAAQRVIGYYESWAGTRPCDQWDPSMISATQITHLNFAFALIDGGNKIVPATSGDTAQYRQAISLKDSNPDLKVFISVGGWAFNDPGPTQKRFSNVASSAANRATFISSCLQFMKTYGFDGIDIDWEYPVDDLRGGVAADKANLVSLLKEFRAAISSSGTPYGLTITTPSSYYYLRHFDVAEIAKWIDWFNHMTYDLHGVWDKDSKFLGPYVNSHSNLTEIDISMNLFWRNNIPPNKISMGLGFYGRSFQLANSACTKPGCLFTGPAKAGACTGAAGILSYSEIQAAIGGNAAGTKRAATVQWDKTAAVKYAYWGDQWISYDDADTFKQKLDYANGLGLGGMLIWAIDQDDGNYSAMDAISGTAGKQNIKIALKADGQKLVKDAKPLKDVCSTTKCSTNPKCPSGKSAVGTQSSGEKLSASCKKGQSKLVCCPADNLPDKCRWAGDAPNCATLGKCADGEEELAKDDYGSGGTKCTKGKRAFCCTTPKSEGDALKQCKWFGTAPSCGGDGLCADPGFPVQVTTGRGEGGNGQYCSSGKKVLCCPSDHTYTGCKWEGGWSCINPKCGAGKSSIATDSAGDGGICWLGNHRTYCCNTPTTPAPPPPAKLNGHWGSPKDEGCKGTGYRQWSSKLLDVNGDWNSACVSHPGWIKEKYFEQPTSCDKSVFGIWGKFWVPDDKCCSSSKKRNLDHFEVYETYHLLPRADGCTPPDSGFVNLNPINDNGAQLAADVLVLLQSRPVRALLQTIWQLSFAWGQNRAREVGAYILQHRTIPDRYQFWVGYPDRSGEPVDQRQPEHVGAWRPQNPVQVGRDDPVYFSAGVQDNPDDYTLVAMAHTHPFLENGDAGAAQEPSPIDHTFAWAYGIPNMVVTRLGTFVAGPRRRITRGGVNDHRLTEMIANGNHRLEMTYPMMPYNQIPNYFAINWQPVGGNAAFVPVHVPNQLNEPPAGEWLTIPGHALELPNPHHDDEDLGPLPGSGVPE